MKRPISVAALGALLAVGPIRADGTERVASEAADLFRVVMATEAPPERCEYGVGWITYPNIPDYVASKYLGLTLHADLAAPDSVTRRPSTSPMELLDPEKRLGDAFCRAPERTAYQKARFDAFDKDKSAKKVSLETTGFTFPVFDADYRKAIVIIDRSWLVRYRFDVQLGAQKPGEVAREPAEGVDMAKIYTKTKDGWKLLASEVIDQS